MNFNFRQYPNLTSITIPNSVKFSNNSFYMQFYGMQNLKTCLFDYKNVNNMSQVYYDCKSLTDSPFCGNNVTDMSGMFNYAGYKATTWDIGDISGWDTSNVDEMAHVFEYSNINPVDLRSWNVCNVTDYSNFAVDFMDFMPLGNVIQPYLINSEVSSEERLFIPTNYNVYLLPRDLYKKGENAIVLIGPEGDFSKEEVELAKQNGFVPVSLGEARLRTETAAVVACHTIQLINQMK